jgi:CMP-N-acetylneuraminic acid synthetase
VTRRVTAIVPMRHVSERVPGKNYRLLAGKPLYRHIVETLLDVPEVDEVVVDTDSDVIAQGCLDRFPAQVRVVVRPEHLRNGDTPMNDVLQNTIEQCPADWYVQTHSTNPLLRSVTISAALHQLWRRQPGNDSLFSVSRLQTRLWWSADRAVNHDPKVLLRTQDLPPVYEENSNIYIFRGETLRVTGNRIGVSPILFEIDRLEAWDIDDETDFVLADTLKRNAIRVS